jgi:UDP-glucose 4-epimerase
VLDTVIGRREKVIIYGNDFNTSDGTGVRDYIHVEDIARAHLLAIEKINKYSNNVFNLGSSSSYSVYQIIQIIEDCLYIKIPFEIGHRRPGDPATLTTVSNKAKNILGWVPQKSIIDIIQGAYQWRKNPLY